MPTVHISISGDVARILKSVPTDIEALLKRRLGYYINAWLPVTDVNGRPIYRNGKQVRKPEQILRTKYRYLDRTFPAGMIHRAAKVFHNRGWQVKILDKRPKASVNEGVVLAKLQTLPFEMRPYQIRAVAKGLLTPYMIFYLSTGTGKSIIFGTLIKLIGLKTLVIINRADLLMQHYNLLCKILGSDNVSIMQGKVFNPDVVVNIAMVQTIHAKLKHGNPLNYKMRKYLSSVQYLVSDESHHAKSTTWKQVFRNCKDAKYRHSFSGSPWDQLSENVELEAVSGPILFKYATSNAIEEGYLSQPIITFHKYPHNNDYYDGSHMQSVYTDLIVNNKDRNGTIAKIAKHEYMTTTNQMLIVVQRIAHGYIIAQALRSVGIPDHEIGYLHGSKGRIVREAGRKKFETKKIRIMIVSNIWSEGIDLPDCNVMIKCDALGGSYELNEGEGVRNLVQQIGRILRKPIIANGEIDINKENIVYFHDFIDRQQKYVSNWTDNRIQTCKMERAFVVKVEE